MIEWQRTKILYPMRSNLALKLVVRSPYSAFRSLQSDVCCVSCNDDPCAIGLARLHSKTKLNRVAGSRGGQVKHCKLPISHFPSPPNFPLLHQCSIIQLPHVLQALQGSVCHRSKCNTFLQIDRPPYLIEARAFRIWSLPWSFLQQKTRIAACPPNPILYRPIRVYL